MTTARGEADLWRPDLQGLGTPAAVWQAAGLPERLPPMEPAALLPPAGRIVVLAPHPDDEILGVGGLLARLSRLGGRIHVIAVSDGEASHPGRASELRTVRQRERQSALTRLGIKEATIHRLGLPDGSLRAETIAPHLRPLIQESDVVLAPWVRDGHPDHEACGRAAATLPAPVWSYLVWTWHWADPDDAVWSRAVRIPLDHAIRTEKRQAARAFESQLSGPEPILPPHVLDRLTRADEVLLAAAR